MTAAMVEGTYLCVSLCLQPRLHLLPLTVIHHYMRRKPHGCGQGIVLSISCGTIRAAGCIAVELLHKGCGVAFPPIALTAGSTEPGARRTLHGVHRDIVMNYAIKRCVMARHPYVDAHITGVGGGAGADAVLRPVRHPVHSVDDSPLSSAHSQ